MRILAGLLGLLLCACTPGADSAPSGASSVPADSVVIEQVESEEETFRVVQVVGGLEHPWGVTWLSEDRLIITERPGRMVLVEGDETTPISGVPEVYARGQGGLLDVVAHPEYEETGWIYFTYSASGDGGAGTVLSRARLDGASLTDLEELYRQTPFVEAGIHFGSRIAFLDDGTMLVTLGERGQRRSESTSVQDLSNSIGTTIRLNLDGSIPDDNPFVGREDARPEIYSYGHRNQQGMAIDPSTGLVWQHEHGPRGGDELNLIEPGNNYGWPEVTYGVEYSDGSEIGGTEAPGMTQPVEYWDPSPAFSGMAFYRGERFPNWQNQLFIGALAHQKILRLELDGTEVTHQEELLRNELGRIRDVKTGPDGFLYVLTDAADGGLYRLEPIS